MPSPEAVGAAPLARWETTAMACQVAISSPVSGAQIDAAAGRALDVFADVEQACSRFRPTSALARCNARPGSWHRAPATLLQAVEEARLAHLETGGAFDPRVHDRLVQLGYSRSFTDGQDSAGTGTSDTPAAPARGGWRPRSSRRMGMVNLGGHRIDLGGIGKGLALRWAARVMREATGDFLVEAGGDLVASGSPTGDGRWRIGVEPPDGDDTPLAVLEVSAMAVATSSVRVRRWNAGGRELHHLIDPRTGEPGGAGLLSVTVVGPDPAWAEVWSKTLFLAGVDGVGRLAAERGLAALWATPDGVTGSSPAMGRHVLWVRP